MKKTGLLVFVCLVLTLFLCGPTPTFAAGFCTNSEDLSDELQPFLTLDNNAAGHTIQGMCIADHYLIITRFKSNEARTTYKVYDMETKKVTSILTANTEHSNSMTYNPVTNQLAVVAGKQNGVMYMFRFSDGVLSFEKRIFTSINATRVCYVASVNRYYIANGSNIYSTIDFKSFRNEFTVRHIGVGQGMASDGSHLYLCWTMLDGVETITEVSLTGQEVATYKASNIHEIEELDFYDGNIYLADNRSEQDTIYKLTCNHSYGAWDIVSEPTAKKDGEKERKCLKCGYIQSENISFNEEEDESSTHTDVTVNPERELNGAKTPVFNNSWVCSIR